MQKLWIFGMILDHHSRMQKNRINQKYDTFAIFDKALLLGSS